MAFDITTNSLNASLQSNIEPQIVLQIDGFTKIYGALDIKKFIQYGDAGLTYGSSPVYGGLNSVANQSPYISFSGPGGGTSTTIRQQLQVDKGLGDSISSISVVLIDKDGEVSKELVTPDETQTPTFDILGRRAKLWIGFANVAWPEDFFVIFRGTIDSVDVGAGFVKVNLNSPDSKKKGQIFTRATNTLDGAITSGATVMTLDDASDFLDPTFTGPSGTIDSDLSYYVQIDNEIIKYEAKSATQLQTLTRGTFGTTAAAHSDGASVESIYVLGGDSGGNTLDLALKLMLSGVNGAYEEDRAVTSFVRVDGTSLVDNAIFFKSLDIVKEFNVTVGDFVTTTGATNAANNVTNVVIQAITETTQGTYITLGSAATLVDEPSTSAVIDFRSQYDVFPVGAEMIPDEVDIAEHLNLKLLFLNNDDDYQFLLRDEIELKSFLSEQIYNPVGAFSLPRKARASAGFHLAGLLPGGTIKQINNTNVKNASKLRIQRSTSKNFFNATVYKIDEKFLEEDKFETVITSINTDSRTRIPVGVRPLIINAKGLRTIMGGANIANSATSRRLNKYKFGAEFLKGVKLNFKTGFDLEVGDVVLFDFSTLQVTDIKEAGVRSGENRLMQVDNKSINIRTGEISLDLVDTNFEADNRFGLISPASFVKSGTDTQNFVIESSFNTTQFGQNEFRKWENFIGSEVTVRSTDGATTGSAVLQQISGNAIQVATSLGFTPSAGQIMVFSTYQAAQPLENVKLLYVFQFDGVSFPDSDPSYKML